MTYQPIKSCIFITDNSICCHVERGSGFFGLGKNCILLDDFPSECSKRIRKENRWPKPPPCDDDDHTEFVECVEKVCGGKSKDKES